MGEAITASPAGGSLHVQHRRKGEWLFFVLQSQEANIIRVIGLLVYLFIPTVFIFGHHIEWLVYTINNSNQKKLIISCCHCIVTFVLAVLWRCYLA